MESNEKLALSLYYWYSGKPRWHCPCTADSSRHRLWRTFYSEFQEQPTTTTALRTMFLPRWFHWHKLVFTSATERFSCFTRFAFTYKYLIISGPGFPLYTEFRNSENWHSFVCFLDLESQTSKIAGTFMTTRKCDLTWHSSGYSTEVRDYDLLEPRNLLECQRFTGLKHSSERKGEGGETWPNGWLIPSFLKKKAPKHGRNSANTSVKIRKKRSLGNFQRTFCFSG